MQYLLAVHTVEGARAPSDEELQTSRRPPGGERTCEAAAPGSIPTTLTLRRLSGMGPSVAP
jgi:hypothetical protein